MEALYTKEDDLMHGMLCNNIYKLHELLQADIGKKGYEQTYTKEYYVASILEEAIKFLTSVIRWKDLLGDKFDKEQESTLVGNMIIQGLHSEISLYHRKLLESLINMILWSQITDDKYIEYYYLIKEYNALKSKLIDMKLFYDVESQLIVNDKSNIESKIATIFPAIDEAKCFFINSSTRPEMISSLSIHCVESSLKSRLKEALQAADELEKILIGFTYDNYSFASEKIHLSTELDKQSSEILVTTVRFIFAIISKIAVLCSQWLGVGDLDEFRRLENILSGISAAPAWYTPLLKPESVKFKLYYTRFS